MVSNQGWIGVDLDGTLAHYEKWMGWNVFGEPIGPMIDRVKSWIQEGRDVRILTARVGLPLFMGHKPTFSSVIRHHCRVTGVQFNDRQMVAAIQDWTERHVGARLPVQCWKDVHMIELWDDRCVQIIPNTGRTVAEEAEARYNADGKYSDFRGCE